MPPCGATTQPNPARCGYPGAGSAAREAPEPHGAARAPAQTRGAPSGAPAAPPARRAAGKGCGAAAARRAGPERIPPSAASAEWDPRANAHPRGPARAERSCPAVAAVTCSRRQLPGSPEAGEGAEQRSGRHPHRKAHHEAHLHSVEAAGLRLPVRAHGHRHLEERAQNAHELPLRPTRSRQRTRCQRDLRVRSRPRGRAGGFAAFGAVSWPVREEQPGGTGGRSGSAP